MKRILILVAFAFMAQAAAGEQGIADKAGDVVKKGGEAVARGVEKGGNATVKGLKKAGEWVGKKMQTGGEKLKEASK